MISRRITEWVTHLNQCKKEFNKRVSLCFSSYSNHSCLRWHTIIVLHCLSSLNLHQSDRSVDMKARFYRNTLIRCFETINKFNHAEQSMERTWNKFDDNPITFISCSTKMYRLYPLRHSVLADKTAQLWLTINLFITYVIHRAPEVMNNAYILYIWLFLVFIDSRGRMSINMIICWYGVNTMHVSVLIYTTCLFRKSSLYMSILYCLCSEHKVILEDIVSI